MTSKMLRPEARRGWVAGWKLWIPKGRHVGRCQTEQIRRVQQSGYLENVILRERRTGRLLVVVEFREQHFADRVGRSGATSSRTTAPKRRFRRFSWIVLRRSSASS